MPAIEITPDGKTAYAVGGTSPYAAGNSDRVKAEGWVRPIATATGAVGRKITIKGAAAFGEIAITSKGTEVYVVSNVLTANDSYGKVTAINATTNTAGPAIPIGSVPCGIAVKP